MKGFIDTSKNVVIGPATYISKINKELGCKVTRQGSTDVCQVIELLCVEWNESYQYYILMGT